MIRLLVIRLVIMALSGVLGAIGLFIAFGMLFEEGPHLAFALIGGVILAVAAGLFRNTFDWLARWRLLAGASGRATDTGLREVALRGHLVARDAALHLPFIDGPILAASYSVTARVQTRTVRASGNTTTQTDHAHMGGLVSVPCALRVEGRDIPLLAFPSPFDFPEERRPAAPQAVEILRHAETLPATGAGGFSPRDAFALLDQYGRDAGEGRREEFARPTLRDALSRPDTVLRVQAIPDGAEVCLIGTIAPGTAGIVASVTWGGIGLYPGDARAARGQMLRKAASTGIVATLMAGFATLGFAAILSAVQIDDSARLADLRSAIVFAQTDRARPLLARGLAGDPAEMRALVASAPNGPTLALLAEFGANLDGADDQGVPLLIAAAMRGNFERMNDLLEAGAAPSARGGPGHLSALEWAADRGDPLTADALQKAGVPGRVALQSALRQIEGLDDPAFVALRALYEGTAPFPVAGGFGPLEDLRFAGGLGDGQIATLFIDNGAETRAHVMENRSGDWVLLRITPILPHDGSP